MSRPSVSTVILICAYEPCSKPFMTKSCYKDVRVYCSRVCQYAARGIGARTLPCAECGTPFRVEAHRAATAQFCSTSCHDTWRHKQAMADFWNKAQRCDHEEWCIYCCFPWKGATDNHYKMTYRRNIPIGAHRLAWELFHARPIPPGLQVAHYCHFKACCNPAHLHPATAEGNYEDSIRDHRIHSGEDHHNSKLTEATALEAFRLKTLHWSNQAIADHLHVSKSTIRNLMAGDIWKDLPRPTVLPKLKPGPRTTKT